MVRAYNPRLYFQLTTLEKKRIQNIQVNIWSSISKIYINAYVRHAVRLFVYAHILSLLLIFVE